MLESKLGVVNGESLADDMEGCGDELVLKRVCAPGGEGPKETGETIRSRVMLVGLAIGRERRALNEWECSGLCRWWHEKRYAPLAVSEPGTV